MSLAWKTCLALTMIINLHVKHGATQPRTGPVWLMCTPIGLRFFKGLKGEWREEGTPFFFDKLLTVLKMLFRMALKYVTDFCFNVNRCGNCEALVIIGVTATWRPASWPGPYTSWWQFAQQPVLVFPLSLSRLSFPPPESPRGNCGVIYEVVAAWSRPVYGMACWPNPIHLQRSGPGLLLC